MRVPDKGKVPRIAYEYLIGCFAHAGSSEIKTAKVIM